MNNNNTTIAKLPWGVHRKSYLFREELTSRSWATLNDFPAIRDGYVKRDIIPDDAPLERAQSRRCGYGYP
jgi:hypothetical protein